MPPRLLLVGLLIAVASRAQAPPQAIATTQRPAAHFEVASIRPHGGPLHSIAGFSMAGPRVTLEGYTLPLLVQEAYDLRGYQFSITQTGRERAETYDTYYDLVAVAEGTSTPTRDEIRAMLRTLLAERFNLRTHTQSRELPVYYLTVTNSGPKFKPSSPDEANSGPKGSVSPKRSEPYLRGSERKHARARE